MSKSIFVSQDHQQRFVKAIEQIGKVDGGKIDPEYGSALYILCADAATWNKAEEYVSPDGIEFDEMLSEMDFSGGYSVLIHLAGNLFNNHLQVEAVDIPTRLDENNFQIALQAIRLRRCGLRLSDAMQGE